MSAERLKIREKFPIKYLIMAVWINAAILYLIFSIIYALYVAVVGIGLTVFGFLLTKLKNKPFKVVPRTKPRIIDYILLVKNYFRLTSKYFVVSSVGLIIALLLFSQSSIFINSYQQYAFDNYLHGSQTAAINIQANNMLGTDVQDWQSFFNTHYKKWVNDANLELDSAVSYGSVNFKLMLGNGSNTVSAYIDTKNTVSRTWTRYYYDLLHQLPTFPDIPFNSSESVLVLPGLLTYVLPEFGYITYDPADYVNLINGSYNFNALVDQKVKYFADEPNRIIFNNITLTSDHVWTWSQQDIVYIKEHKLNFPNELLIGSYFIPKGQEFVLLDKFETATQKFGEDPFIWGNLGFESYIKVRIPLLEQLPLDVYLKRLDTLQETVDFEAIPIIQDMTPFKVFQAIQRSIISPLGSLIDTYLNYQNNLTSLMRILTIPLIFISLYLFYFALSLVEKRKTKMFSKLKQKGATSGQLQYIVYSEILAYTIFASLIALVISIQASDYILQRTTVLSISTNVAMVTRIPISLYWRIPALGFLFAFDFSIIPLRDIENLDVSGTQFESTAPSFFERGNYDMILFVLSSIYWLLIPFLSVPSSLNTIVFSYLGYLAIAFTLISLPLLVKRYVIGFVGNTLSKLPRGRDTSFLSIKGLYRNSKFTSKFVAIFILTIMFAYMGMISSNTIVTMNENISKYNLGSDGLVSGVGVLTSPDWKRADVAGVVSYSKISRFYYLPNTVEIPSGSNVDNMVKFDVMGVNISTFAQTAYWQDSFADTSLSQILQQLQTPGSIAIQSNTLHNLGLKVGDDYTYSYGYQSREKGTFHINSTFDLFPNLITNVPQANVAASRVKEVQMVVSLETFDLLLKNFNRHGINSMLLKFDPNVNPAKIRSDIISSLIDKEYLQVLTYESNKVSIFDAGSTEVIESPLAIYEELYLVTSLYMLLVVSFITAFCALLYYGFYMFNERKEEVGIYRAFGMVNTQITMVFLMEFLILIFIGLFTGLLAGIGLSLVIYSVIGGQPVKTVPPLHLQIPYLLVVGYGGTILLIGCIVAYIISKRMANREVRSILRAE